MNRKIASLLRAGALAALVLATTGCISLLPEPPDPPAVFPLLAQDAGAAPAGRSTPAPSIAVMPVQAPSALSGPELAIAMSDGSLAYVRGAVWSQDAPDALRALLLGTFDRTGLARAASTETGARADVLLSVDLVSFALSPSQRRTPARADIVVAARLLDGRNRSVLAVRRFAASGPAESDGPAAAAAALGAVARTAAAEVTAWAAQTAAARGASGG